MSSRRRDRSRSPRSRLRMDSYTKGGRSKVSPPRSREIDSVMKRARRSDSQSTYWNKKLLEAEEKDPNRWRHSGYKELYHHTGSSRSNSESGSRSKSGSRSRSASKSSSPKRARSKSSVRSPRSPRRTSRARSPRKARSPRSPRKESRARSPRDSRARSPRDSRARSPRSSRARSPRRDSTLRAIRRDSRARSPRRSRSPLVRARTPRARSPLSPRSRSPRVRRRTPPRQVHHRQGRSASNSSDTSSSCSDESCSVCSPKRKSSKERPRPKEPPPERKREVVQYRPPPFIERSRSRSFSVPRSKPHAPVEKVKKKSKKAVDKSVIKVNRAYIKREKHDSDSESSSGRGSTVDIVSSMAGPKLSLSERFGRMAQWSVDRDLEHRNLRITSGDRLTVEMDSPPSPLYPPSLSSIAEMGGSWDDVRVRYAYYKERGYLRDLTLADYIKWEQWWYKYQDWLDSDRYYGRRRV